MKKFCVLYSVTTSYDTTIKAKDKEEAKKKVIEVIGEPVEIDDVYEVHQ
ncbi:MAG TPA: hypothetical protein VNX68_03220 [Nitrosopumilaceae archaeon]|jgi:hypothetical protein|nr:hypothetical protein [Nitrosopumilaceae archaeon]